MVVGGFPLLGSYERVLLSAERDADALLADDDTAASIQSDFDVRAALSFYRELAALPDGALVTEVGCPMFAFWGTGDDILWSFNVASDFGECFGQSRSCNSRRLAATMRARSCGSMRLVVM